MKRNNWAPLEEKSAPHPKKKTTVAKPKPAAPKGRSNFRAFLTGKYLIMLHPVSANGHFFDGPLSGLLEKCPVPEHCRYGYVDWAVKARSRSIFSYSLDF
jgi:hypothetical protein